MPSNKKCTFYKLLDLMYASDMTDSGFNMKPVVVTQITKVYSVFKSMMYV